MFTKNHCLSNTELERYGRHIIVEEFGVEGQQAVRSKSVLIVGAGGLGCPVAMYCAGAGFGRIGIVDDDYIAIHNLHRQIAYSTQKIGLSKVSSLKAAINSSNKDVEVDTFEERLTKFNVMKIISKYDVIADCSDNITTRYILSDACVMEDKPMVSGSALRWDGQMTVYNFGKDCPCYRCIHPDAPHPATLKTCSENGIIGPVVGVIGSAQALEIIKIAALQSSCYAGRLLLFDGLHGNTKTVTLRKRLKNCACRSMTVDTRVCNLFPSYDLYEKCEKAVVPALCDGDRWDPAQFDKEYKNHKPIVIDVRPPHEYGIMHVKESYNIPLRILKALSVDQLLAQLNCDMSKLLESNVCVVCRRGNDSQEAVCNLSEKFRNKNIIIRDIIGGYEEWAKVVGEEFPSY